MRTITVTEDELIQVFTEWNSSVLDQPENFDDLEDHNLDEYSRAIVEDFFDRLDALRQTK